MEGDSKNKKILAVAVVVAIILLFSAFVFGPRLVVLYYAKAGLENYRQKNFSTAKEKFSNSVYWNPEDSVSHVWLGRIALGPPAPSTGNYYPQADYPEAIKHFEESLSLGLDKVNVRLHSQTLDDVGFSYWNLKQYDKALGKYLEKIQRYPQESFWARYFAADDYFRRSNKPQEALDLLAPAIDMASSDNDRRNLFRFYTLLSRLYSYFEDFDNAESYAKLAIASAPAEEEKKHHDIQIAHNILAFAAAKNGDLATAEAEIKKATELAGMPLYECLLAKAYYLAKNYTKAIAVAKNAAKIKDRVDSVCLGVLGQSLVLQDKKVEAQKYMEEFMALTNNFQEKNIFTVRDREEFQEELDKL